jgi:hypothetical protein
MLMARVPIHCFCRVGMCCCLKGRVSMTGSNAKKVNAMCVKLKNRGNLNPKSERVLQHREGPRKREGKADASVSFD